MTRTTSTTSTRTPRPTRPMLRGAFTALVTPFTPDGALDEAAFRRLVRWQILAGIDGLVPCGTTGESPTLSESERERLIAATVEVAGERSSRARVRVVAGTGTNDTAATIRATRRAAELGADAALVVAPYYNRPDGRMLEAHYRAVADEGDLPIVVYNVPGRTGTNVDADTFLRLAEHPRVVAVKEASGNLEQIARICRERPRDVAVLAGDDAWTLPVLAMGGDGVVSVASNQVPGELVALCAAARAGDWEAARRTHERWLPLFLGNFRGGPNPVPAKAALMLMGLLETDAVRAPLLPAGGRRSGRDGGHAPLARPARVGRWPDLDAGRPRGRGMTTETEPAPGPRAPSTAIDPDTILADLETGRIRAAEPDDDSPDGWRVRPDVKAGILACFADRTTQSWTVGPLTFRDRAAVPPRGDLADGPWRIVPGGTAIRRGAHLARGRRRHAALVRQRRGVGRRGHDGRLARARRVVRPDRGTRPPVRGRDDRWRARAGRCAAGHRRGRRVRRGGQRPARGRAGSDRGAVIGAGVTLTGTSRLYDLVRGRVLTGTTDAPLVVPAGAVVVPGARSVPGAFAAEHGLSASVALLVKDRDAGTAARVALEDALR